MGCLCHWCGERFFPTTKDVVARIIRLRQGALSVGPLRVIVKHQGCGATNTILAADLLE